MKSRRLLVPKKIFKATLLSRIAEGQRLSEDFDKVDQQHRSSDVTRAFDKLEKGYSLWDSYNKSWLEESFGRFNSHLDTYTKSVNWNFLLAHSSVQMGASKGLPYKWELFKINIDTKIEQLEKLLNLLDFIPEDAPTAMPGALTQLHPIIQEAASELFAGGHYRQAILDAYIALDVAVQQKSQVAGNGTRLMEQAFSPNNPVLRIGESNDEQQGFMALFRGAMLAIRNPKVASMVQQMNSVRWNGCRLPAYYCGTWTTLK